MSTSSTTTKSGSLSTRSYWITGLSALRLHFVCWLKDRFRNVIRKLWPPYFGGEYSLGFCDVCCLISVVIPLVCGSVNERVDCIISSILSLALPLIRLVVNVLDKIVGIFPCRMWCFVVVFWIA
jgi:hypothetical protein